MDAAVFAIFYFSRAEKVVLHAERTESLALELGRMERKKNAHFGNTQPICQRSQCHFGVFPLPGDNAHGFDMAFVPWSQYGVYVAINGRVSINFVAFC